MAEIMSYGEQYDISAKSCLFMNLPNLQVTGESQSSYSLSYFSHLAKKICLSYSLSLLPFKVYVVHVCKLLRITSRTNQKE